MLELTEGDSGGIVLSQRALVDYRRGAFGVLSLLVAGAVLALGGGSAILMGLGPLRFANLDPFDAYCAYGCAAATLALLSPAGLLLWQRKRGLPAVWLRLAERELLLPIASLVAGLGVGFFVGTYWCTNFCQWSLGANVPWIELDLIRHLSFDVLCPLALGVVALAARSLTHALLALVALGVGFEIGFPASEETLNRLFNLEPGRTRHELWAAPMTGAMILVALKHVYYRGDKARIWLGRAILAGWPFALRWLLDELQEHGRRWSWWDWNWRVWNGELAYTTLWVLNTFVFAVYAVERGLRRARAPETLPTTKPSHNARTIAACNHTIRPESRWTRRATDS